MSPNRFLFLASLACVVAPVVHGEAHCPGSAVSLPLRLIQNTLFVASVEVNGTGSYDFLVDTGAQVNSIDATLAGMLSLTPKGAAGVNGAATYSRNLLVGLDLRAGGKLVESSLAVLIDAAQLQTIDPHIRGILGGTFLEHFDFLLDNQHRVLCLDDSGTLFSSLKGQRIALAEPMAPERTPVPFTRPLVVLAGLSGFGKPRILLLDSGSNSPSLFLDRSHIQPAVSRSNRTLKRLVNGVEQDFIVMPPQEVRIGKTVLGGTEFAVPMNSIGEQGPALQEDGLLPTMAFRRVFVSCSKGYVLLDPWD